MEISKNGFLTSLRSIVMCLFMTGLLFVSCNRGQEPEELLVEPLPVEDPCEIYESIGFRCGCMDEWPVELSYQLINQIK